MHHPLWRPAALGGEQNQSSLADSFLPLLYLLARFVRPGLRDFLLLVAGLRLLAAARPRRAGELGNLLSCACFLFLAVRAGDLLWRGQVHAAFAFDKMSILFLVEPHSS